MSRPGYTISNEDLLLINILNGMYNDNLRQIERMNTSINTLNADNLRIRNLLIRLLRNPRENNNARVPNNAAGVPNNAAGGANNTTASDNNRTPPTNTTLPTSIFGSSGRTGSLFVNNAPYVIDSFQQYRIPGAAARSRSTSRS